MDRKTAQGRKVAPSGASPAPAWPALAARLAAGGLLAFAGALKAAAPAEEFALVIEHYGLFGPDAALSLAAFLPWLELFFGWALILGFFSRAAAAACAAMLGAFSLAILSTFARGIQLPNCGCFGGGLQVSPAVTLALDLALLAAAVWLWRRGPGKLSLDNWAGRGYT